ncbi:MAG: ParB/RepB/Spo0J family partition protein [Phycisphaerales bacterium]|nr:ParB/RepB/Spo0J family partition protein [Phycisphaerales bacterium]
MPEVESAEHEGLCMLPLDAVVPSPFQPRRTIDQASVEQLASSIRRSGVMQPVIVRSLGAGRYELVVGERRWRASRVAQLTHIPALVRDLADEEAAEWALVENVQREDLNAMERAHALRGLCERFGMTQTQVAERVALDRSTVTNLIRLTELEDSIATLLEQGKLSMGHGRALLGAPAGVVRESLAVQAAAQAWSVRKLERECQRMHAAKPSAGKPSPRAMVLADLEKQIADQLGTKVMIRADRKGVRGRVVIEFYGHDHFEGLLARMGVRTHG